MIDTTIAAISTAMQNSGISVIRVSGNKAIEICDRVFKAKSGKKLFEMKGYTAAFGNIYSNGEMIDECIATVFLEPHSYTGENVVELSCHGGLCVTKEVLRTLFENGAVAAEAGEFTKRAFLNSKLDLIEAQAVMDIINAKSKNAVKAAVKIKEGALSKRIQNIKSDLSQKAAHLCAWADYPEEDIPQVSFSNLKEALTEAENKLEVILEQYDNGKILKDGINTVIVGKPNVGKSTLMNLLSGYDKSIITDIPGTTRDIVEENVNLGNITLNLSDTAGIRHSKDLVEQIGVDKAKERLKTASLVLCVFDLAETLSDEDRQILSLIDGTNSIAIFNKSDLEKKLDTKEIESKVKSKVYMSAKFDDVEVLKKEIERVCEITDFDENESLIYNERQRSLTLNAKKSIREAIDALDMGITLDAVTVSIEDAISSLAELTGENVTDSIIDQVFHTFCVGK